MTAKWLTEGWICSLSLSTQPLNLAGCPASMRMGSGWNTGWQQLDQGLLYYFSSGDAILNQEEIQEQSLSPGTLVVVPAGQRFCLRAGAGKERQFTRFRFTHEPVDGGPAVVMHQAQSLVGLVRELAEESSGHEAMHVLRANALLTALFTAVVRLSYERQSGEHQMTVDQRHRIQTWCDDNIHGQLSGKDIARLLGLSHDYCTRLFRRSYGMPPRQWLVRQRLRHIATAVVETDRSITDIAAEYGYNNLSLLGRQFAGIYGMPPAAYRRKQRR